MSPTRPCSSSARSALSLPTGRKEKTTTTTKPAGAREPPKRSSFPCMVCGKRFPSQQAMAGHCSAHTRAARRTAMTRQQQPLPMVVTMQLTVLWPLTPVQYMPPPGAILPMCRCSLLLPCSVKGGDACSTTTTQPASAMVDVTLRLGAGVKRAHKRTLPLVESPAMMVPNHSHHHRHPGEQGREGRRATVMDGSDHSRNKGKDKMDGLDLELRLHR